MTPETVLLWGSCKVSLFPKKVEYPFKVFIQEKNFWTWTVKVWNDTTMTKCWPKFPFWWTTSLTKQEMLCETSKQESAHLS